MSWKTFKAIGAKHGMGCPHAKAPNGCQMTTYKCVVCGAEVKHQCGNNALIGQHQCVLPKGDTD